MESILEDMSVLDLAIDTETDEAVLRLDVSKLSKLYDVEEGEPVLLFHKLLVDMYGKEVAKALREFLQEYHIKNRYDYLIDGRYVMLKVSQSWGKGLNIRKLHKELMFMYNLLSIIAQNCIDKTRKAENNDNYDSTHLRHRWFTLRREKEVIRLSVHTKKKKSSPIKLDKDDPFELHLNVDVINDVSKLFVLSYSTAVDVVPLRMKKKLVQKYARNIEAEYMPSVYAVFEINQLIAQAIALSGSEVLIGEPEYVYLSNMEWDITAYIKPIDIDKRIEYKAFMDFCLHRV